MEQKRSLTVLIGGMLFLLLGLLVGSSISPAGVALSGEGASPDWFEVPYPIPVAGGETPITNPDSNQLADGAWAEVDFAQKYGADLGLPDDGRGWFVPQVATDGSLSAWHVGFKDIFLDYPKSNIQLPQQLSLTFRGNSALTFVGTNLPFMTPEELRVSSLGGLSVFQLGNFFYAHPASIDPKTGAVINWFGPEARPAFSVSGMGCVKLTDLTTGRRDSFLLGTGKIPVAAEPNYPIRIELVPAAYIANFPWAFMQLDHGDTQPTSTREVRWPFAADLDVVDCPF